MGFRFHRVLSVIPGVRINLSKSGVSTSVGPRGADINIGRHGVTTNAGIPGTGISYRSKLGGHGGKLGVLALVAGLGFAAFKNSDRIASLFQHPPKTVAAAATDPPFSTARNLIRRAWSRLFCNVATFRYIRSCRGSRLNRTDLARGLPASVTWDGAVRGQL